MRRSLLLLLAGLGCASPSGPSSGGFSEEPLGNIVFTWRPVPGYPQPYQVRPDGSGFAPVPVPGNFGDRPEVSRDGRRLLFLDGRNLFVMDLESGALVKLTYDSNWDWPSWSPEGQRFIAIRFDDRANAVLHVKEADGSGERAITLPLSPHVGFITHPAFFPSGDSLLYVKHAPFGQLWLGYADGRPPRLFDTSWGSSAGEFALSRDGRRLAVGGILAKTDSGIPDDFSVRIAVDHDGPVLTANFAPNWVQGMSFSPDGKFLVVEVARPETGITWLEILEISTMRRRHITPEPPIGSTPIGVAVDAKWGP